MVRNHKNRHTSNEISFNGILFFLDYSFDIFSKNSAYNAIKKYHGNAKAVYLSKQAGDWVFDREIN